MIKAILFLCSAAAVWAQTNVLTVTPPPRLHIQRGQVASATLKAKLDAGFHVNSDKPNDEFLIPLKLSWNGAPLQVSEIVYPKAVNEKASFSEKPVSVFTGEFEIATRFKAPASAPQGMTILTAKLRYQACNNRMCLAPKTIEIPLTADVR